jgi:fructokinase
MHLVCGEALFDIFVESESTGDVEEVTLHAVSGGSPFNVAIGLARLGVPVALATDIACDALGQRLARRIAAEGVCDVFVNRAAPTTALAFITLRADGTPTYDFNGLREAVYAPELPSVLEASAQFSNFHLGSIALVLPQSSEKLLKLASRLAGEMLVSLDPNVRLAIEPDAQRWRQAIERIRPFAHVVKVSEEDIALAFGADVDPEHLCQQWLRDNTELVALTRGSAGATLFARGTKQIAIEAIPVSVMDTVGAGDSFMAALLARLAKQGRATREGIALADADALEDLGRYAAAAAALTCSRRGPALPRHTEVEALTGRSRKAA